MTTSWAWLLRGEIGRALAANAGGTLLAGLSLAGIPWLLVSALRGRWFGGTPNEWAMAGIAGLAGLVIAGQWAWRLLTFYFRLARELRWIVALFHFGGPRSWRRWHWLRSWRSVASPAWKALPSLEGYDIPAE